MGLTYFKYLEQVAAHATEPVTDNDMENLDLCYQSAMTTQQTISFLQYHHNKQRVMKVVN